MTTPRPKPRGSLGTDWHMPHPKGGYYKRPFATTTVASAGLITLLAEDGQTWSEVATAIRYDDEALVVATAFVEAGHGDTAAVTMLARQ